MDDLQITASEIDDYYDSLLVTGMDMETARQIEQQRQQAHDSLTQQAFSRALASPMQIDRW